MSKFSFNVLLKVVIAVLTAVFQALTDKDSDDAVEGLS